MDNRRFRLYIFCFILTAALACGTGYAAEDEMPPAGEDQTQPAQTPAEGQESVAKGGKVSPEAMRRWQQLSPEQKKKVRRNWKKIKNLPPERRREIVEKYKKWKQLPPDQKRRIREKFQRLKKLSPEQRQQLRERMGKWRNLPPERKQELREEFKQRVHRKRGSR